MYGSHMNRRRPYSSFQNHVLWYWKKKTHEANCAGVTSIKKILYKRNNIYIYIYLYIEFLLYDKH